MLLSLLFINFRFLDLVDILAVALLLFWLYKVLKGSTAINIFLGVLLIYLLWKLVEALKMELLSEILGQFIGVGVIALLIVFQQEIRNFLIMIGKSEVFKSFDLKRWLQSKQHNLVSLDVDTALLSNAMVQLAEQKLGALIVIQRQAPLDVFLRSGITINAQLSEELLLSLFFKNNPLHDGAIVIHQHQVLAAKCVLPLSDKELPSQFGMRHRAAIGISENTDALALIVSEEKGSIGAAIGGNLFENLQPEELEKRIANWLVA